MVEWTMGEKKRLKEQKKVESNEWCRPSPSTNETPEEQTNNNDEDYSQQLPAKWFPGFITFYLFGPTRTGIQYSSLWRRSADDMNTDKAAKKAGGRAGMKAAESGKMAKEKRLRDEAEARRAKRIEEQEKMNRAQVGYSIASVAQARDEFEAQRFDSELVRISKLIDAEKDNREFAFMRQGRYEPGTEQFDKYEDEINEHQKKIKQYTSQLRELKRCQNSASAHVDAFLGMAREITSGNETEAVEEIDDGKEKDDAEVGDNGNDE